MNRSDTFGTGSNVHIVGDGSPATPAVMFSGSRSWRMRGIAARRETVRSMSPDERAAYLSSLRAIRSARLSPTPNR